MFSNRQGFFYIIIRKIIKTYQRKVHGLFDSILVETYSGCNRSCSFCFQSEDFSERKNGRMPLASIYKIVDELKVLNYAGRISFHFFGEPLLDKRLPKIVDYTRKSLPFCQIRFSTNGDYLTEDKLLELISAGMDVLTVTNYETISNKKLELLSKKYKKYIIYRNLLDTSKEIRSRSDMRMHDVNHKAMLPCYRPKNQLVINWEGDSVLCCNDFYKKYSFGNVKNDTIENIWNHKKLISMRRELSKAGGRKSYKFCENCDL